jgi:hypothetical protein
LFENLDKLPQFQIGDPVEIEVDFSEFPEEYIQFLRDLIPNATLVKIEKVDKSKIFYDLIPQFKTNYEHNFIAFYSLIYSYGNLIKVGIYGNIKKDSEIYTIHSHLMNENEYSKYMISSMCADAKPLMLNEIPANKIALRYLVKDIKKRYPSRKVCMVDPKNLILGKVHCATCDSPVKNHDANMICAATSKNKFNYWHICKDSKSCEFKSALL